MKVLVFGEILWDIIDGVPHLGGAPLNFATHIRKCGGESDIISCLGFDELGEMALERVQELGFDSTLIQRSKKKTGTVPVTIHNGQPEYEILQDVAFDHIRSKDLDKTKIVSYDSFYFGSLIQRNDVSANTLKFVLENNSFREVFYDVNLRKDCFTQGIIEDSLEHCTILKVNDDEVEEISRLIFGEEKGLELFSRLITNRYAKIKIIIITAGSAGAYIYHKRALKRIPTNQIQVMDTVGAGDAFSAAFITSYFKTDDPIRSAEIANSVGGYVASQSGAIPDYSDALLKQIQIV